MGKSNFVVSGTSRLVNVRSFKPRPATIQPPKVVKVIDRKLRPGEVAYRYGQLA